VAAFDSVRRLAGLTPALSAAALAARYGAARLTAVVTLLIAAYFFTLDAFAAFGVYAALANLAWAGVFLRYENAVIAAGAEDEARAAVRLCAAVGALLWGLISLLVLASIALGLFPARLALFFPLGLAGRAALRLAMAASTREGDFPGLGRTVLIQALLQPLVLLALALALADGALCLVIADAVSHAVGAAYLCARRRGLVLGSLEDFSRREVAATARRWASLPVLNLPGVLFGVAFAASPLLIMPLVAAPELAGAVALAVRLFDAPTQIVIAATAPVLMNRLRTAEHATAPVFGRRLMAGFAALIGAAFLGSAVAFLLAVPWLEGTIFASLAPIVWPVAVFQGALAVAGPLAEACALYRRQTALALIHLAALAGSGFALLAAWVAGPMAGLTLLALAAIVRTAAVGERLRALSRHARQETDRIRIEALP
jgi:hypothetical protein